MSTSSGGATNSAPSQSGGACAFATSTASLVRGSRRATNLDDTSIAIGLACTRGRGEDVARSGATRSMSKPAFVEERRGRLCGPRSLPKGREGIVRTVAYEGEFGTLRAVRSEKWLGEDTALIFVDPTGWKGAAMRFIAPLLRGQPARRARERHVRPHQPLQGRPACLSPRSDARVLRAW